MSPNGVEASCILLTPMRLAYLTLVMSEMRRAGSIDRWECFKLAGLCCVGL